MEDNTMTLAIIVICVIMSSYFSATETAFSSLNRIRIKNMVEKGNKKASLVLKISERFDSMLSTILIGNNIVNIFASSLTTILFVRWLGEGLGPSVSTLVLTIIILIFGEITPKSIAKEIPERFAMFSAPILNMLMYILTPINWIFSQWKKLLAKFINVSEDKGITEEELLTIVEEAEQGGGIGEQEGDLIRSAIEFNELEAVDIFTPKTDVVAVSVDMSKDEVAKVFTETGFSRLPVYKENLDQIVGILYHKDFYNYIYNTDKKIIDNLRPVVYIPKNKNIDDLMKELQQKKLHFAVVLDEFGGTLGIVTLEDIIEEIVGEIWDEHDKIVQEIEELSEKQYVVSGKTNVYKIFEMFDKDYDEIEAITINGWIMDTLGKIPNEGDKFTSNGFEVKVKKMSGKRVDKAEIILLEEEVVE